MHYRWCVDSGGQVEPLAIVYSRVSTPDQVDVEQAWRRRKPPAEHCASNGR